MNFSREEGTLHTITNSNIRKSLYHYTDQRNLQSIARQNALYSCQAIDPRLSRQRRSQSTLAVIDGITMYANDQLKIASSMMADGVTDTEFRVFLDHHVFFWPTLINLKKMLESYRKRQPSVAKVVLKFQAYLLLKDNYDRVLLSKYNSGSSPLYPKNCTYKKSPTMFLPLDQFGKPEVFEHPRKTGEINEILIRGKVMNIAQYLDCIYCNSRSVLPDKWKHLYRDIALL